ncbi:MAG: right-handed parallel beta-helix repeat-containing protein [Ignavibacteria bacterium]
MNETGQGRTFFVSAIGNDANTGLSENDPWKTINKLNKSLFLPGDSILLNGGDVFNGNLILNNSDGSDSDQITISSYGTGQAILQTLAGNGITIYNRGGYKIKNIKLSGGYDSAKAQNTTDKISTGINIHNYNFKKRCSGIEISNCTICNFTISAISIGGDSDPAYGFSSVMIKNSTIYNCGNSGIYVWGLTRQDIKITGNIVYNIYGYVPHPNGFSGNGIILSQVYNAVIERNLVFNNGKYAQRSGGGIVTGESGNIIVRYNEIYGIKANDIDGDAIDFDNGSDSCLAEYNYTHNNDGASVLISGNNGSSGSDHNIIRYNISKNDGLKNNCASIIIYSIGAKNNRIYNNTIISTSKGRNIPRCIGIYVLNTGTLISNNIFFSENSSLLVEVDNSKHIDLIFRGNSYYTNNRVFVINWGTTQFYSYEAFVKGSGQEISGIIPVGMSVNPLMINPLTPMDTVNNAYMIDTLSAYKLRSNSPLIGQGINLDSLFFPPALDFYGTVIPTGLNTDIGAYEHK